MPQRSVNPHGSWIIFAGYSVLVAPPDGSFVGDGRDGLFDFDTRILSRHRILVNGEPPEFVGGGLLAADRSVAHLTSPRPGGDRAGPVLPQDVELVLDHQVGCGLREWLTVTNHSMADADLELIVELDADFADVLDIGRHTEGERTVRWTPEDRSLEIRYAARQAGRALERGLRVHVAAADSAPEFEHGRFRFRFTLPARGRWRADLVYGSLVDGRWRDPRLEEPELARRAALRRRWRESRADLETTSPLLAAAFGRAADDLFDLRNWEYDVADDAWIPNAGVPTYTGIFGRDTLTSGWQAALIGPEPMRGSLARLAASQATQDSAWRDEEPGKLLHERRRGPLSELDIVPQGAYYGEQTAPALFVIALSEYWHWTGDMAALSRHRDAALRAIEWGERYGDRDGDGFLEYQSRSPKGLQNQAWKDSDEAIRYADGSVVSAPIATVEEQAYHYVALQRMAEILLALGEEDRAEPILERARRLRKAVARSFWMEDERYYALALDPEKRQVTSIASNAGHALATGIVPPEHAAEVARRLLDPDLFSGWGVRTLSTQHPSYNPYAYHLGTVWPVENATFALGFKRYGLDQEVEQLATAMFEAAAHFEGHRLPEALGGHPREPGRVPTRYPQANAPQAWSASAVILLLQAMLGIYPFAPAKLLALVRPRLPPWISRVTLRRLRVGEASVAIRFTRRADGTAEHRLVERTGTVHVIRTPPPADVGSGRAPWRDQLMRWALEHAPGRTARLLRIALGLEG